MALILEQGTGGVGLQKAREGVVDLEMPTLIASRRGSHVRITPLRGFCTSGLHRRWPAQRHLELLKPTVHTFCVLMFDCSVYADDDDDMFWDPLRVPSLTKPITKHGIWVRQVGKYLVATRGFHVVLRAQSLVGTV